MSVKFDPLLGKLRTADTVGLASQAEAQAGVANDKFMSPLRTKEAIDAQVLEGCEIIGNVEIDGDLSVTSEDGIFIADKMYADELKVNGNPLAAQIILGFAAKPALNEADWLLLNTPMTIEQTNAGVAYATMDAAASTTIHLYKNAGTVGTVMWATAANEGTISLTSDVSLAAGDRIILAMDNTPDADLSDIQVSLKGVL